ncbi:MAG: 23S rRNA (uracil(1939)-C(5))-methyltransferase RlmD [Lachnospiraceae bacterium]|nr:23S rRNA (uracil(1939)-C(5))-methyltransferase RlmD [Lachnospiraceae bacterium]
MKKGDIVSGIIEKVNYPNRGIMHVEGLPVTVKNCAPGQKLEVRITKKYKDRAEGTMQRLLEPSPTERPAPCPQFGTCGGCTWLNLPVEEECRLKAAQVKSLLDAAVCGRSYVFEGILKSPVEFGYRNKMEFTFGDGYKGGPLVLGLHRRGSNFDLVSAADCVIAGADQRAVLVATQNFFGEMFDRKEITFYHRMAHTGYLRHLLVRQAAHTGEMLVDLVTTSQEEHSDAVSQWCSLIRALPLSGKLAGILHTRNDSLSDTIEDQGTEVLWGTDCFSEELLGLTFTVTPFSFFQTNSYGAEVLYDTARRYLKECMEDQPQNQPQGQLPVVYDLYSGTGTISQLVAPVARKVIGVEIVEEAVEAARRNASVNGIGNCEFIAGDVLKVLDEITDKPDLIILDPPRDGIHPKALPRILSYGVRCILYISCKPTSLTRDLAAIQEAGYTLRKAVCIDQFPYTANVETIVLLSKLDQMPIDYIHIGIDLEDEDFTDAEKGSF